MILRNKCSTAVQQNQQKRVAASYCHVVKEKAGHILKMATSNTEELAPSEIVYMERLKYLKEIR